MNLFATHLKLTPYYKSTILQLKKKSDTLKFVVVVAQSLHCV